MEVRRLKMRVKELELSHAEKLRSSLLDVQRLEMKVKELEQMNFALQRKSLNLNSSAPCGKDKLKISPHKSSVKERSHEPYTSTLPTAKEKPVPLSLEGAGRHRSENPPRKLPSVKDCRSRPSADNSAPTFSDSFEDSSTYVECSPSKRRKSDESSRISRKLTFEAPSLPSAGVRSSSQQLSSSSQDPDGDLQQNALDSESDEDVLIERARRALTGKSPLKVRNEADKVYMGSGVSINRSYWEERLLKLKKDSQYLKDCAHGIWGRKALSQRVPEKKTAGKKVATPKKVRLCKAYLKGRLYARGMSNKKEVDEYVKQHSKKWLGDKMYDCSRESRPKKNGKGKEGEVMMQNT